MGKVVGQRYEVYKYASVKDVKPKKGEKVLVTDTPILMKSK